ncbi:kinesin-like protein KIF20A isoform X2 [Mauremys reevesii]|uniref:kinesin-like protein KIF20A isoform X2 n=1 Tax=Mauremys reevesii TaxID=260615 RepID=UPI00193FB118|nr:kinesin-like protein KIF20A isoform X2 [Mauremys reevesii]
MMRQTPAVGRSLLSPRLGGQLLSLCHRQLWDKRMDYEEGSYASSAVCDVLDFTCYEDLMGKTSPMELSVIPNADEQQQEMYQPLKVYLRVRPFSKAELESNESQDCVIIENPETVTLQAPKESFTMKNSEKGIGQSVHQFTFTKVFGPETTQSDFFEGTMKEIVKAYIDGANGLVFSYGVTNAGKTFTIQGSPKDGGILPRSLDMIFHHIRGRQYLKMNFKPYLSNDVKKLDVTQVKQEEIIKAAVLASLKEDTEDTLKSTIQSESLCILESVSSSSCTSASLPSHPLVEDSVLLDASGTKHQRTQSSVWVSFCEIYNEYVYDLMDVLAISKYQKRKVLKICEDQGGNSYIKDLKWINVQSTEEACKILKIGNKNRSLACTRMNQHSSRSHSIFSIRLLRLSDEAEPRILGVSEMSLCDLAGSERCNKTQTFGDRLKEAGNINNSLFILGKCIAALKQKQNPNVKHSYIPFRESKLTRLFQPFFCGKGKACMIVNVNQCASTHSETLHIMKFSATAKQVIQTIHPQTFGYFAPKLVGKDGKPIVHFDANISAEEVPDEDIDTSSEEEVDITIMTHEELLKTTENLKKTLVAERQSKLLLEVQIRKEMAEAMFQQLLETEETWSKRLEDMRESYEEKLENKFEMYKEAIKKHAYMCAMEQIEDHYVPIEEFVVEQEKVEDRDRKILELQQKFGEWSDGLLASEIPNSDVLTAEDKVKSDLKYKEMQRTSEVLQRQCDEKDELIKSLKLKMHKLNETLQEVNEVCRKTTEENNRLTHMVMLKEQEMRSLQNWAKRVLELEATVSLLQEELDERKKHLYSEDLKEQKPKRGLFANLKSTVAGTSKTPVGKTLGKSEDSPTMSRKQATFARKVKE